MYKLLFIPCGGIEVGLLHDIGKPLGREHADGGTTREEELYYSGANDQSAAGRAD